MSAMIKVSGDSDFEYLKSCVALSRAFVLIRHKLEDREKALDLANRLRETAPNAADLAFNGTDCAVEGAIDDLFVAVAEVTFWGYSFRTHTFQETEALRAYQEAAAKINCGLLVIDL